MKFIPVDDINTKNVLNIRELEKQKPCPHCHKNATLICHGFSHGYSSNGIGKEIRRLRFFCSNRHNQHGCGKTHSLLWSNKLEHTSLSVRELLPFITAYSVTQNAHSSWAKLKVSFSITTAYRLVNRWRNALSHIRSHLIRSKPPPHQKNLSQDSDNVLLKTLYHLEEVYPKAICCITEFQQQHQVPFFPK